MNDNKYVNLIKEAVAKKAMELGIHPQEVTKNHLADEVTDWTFKRSGGLDLVKKTYFPVTGKDLAGIHEAKLASGYTASLETKLGSQESFVNHFIEAVKKNDGIKVTSYVSKKKAKINRITNLILSDLHIGSDIKKAETGNLDFGRIEESRRLAKITKEAIEYKSQYRDHTSLNVFLLGDEIQHALHDPRDGAPLAEQCARAINLLAQCIGQLAANYPSVNVYCNTGNHGRNTARHHGRATNQKWDSIETILHYSLSQIFASVKNVKFVIPKTPYVVAENFGKKLFLTHGDSVLNAGYPGKAINTGNLEKQINRINATLKDADEYSVFIVGHVHTGSITHLANGAVMITNGALVPSDEFAVSIGLLENACGQYMFESVEGYPVGDCRFIRVSEEDDKNKELDKIIKPFEGF